jgi:ERCC4-type nuclease
MIILIDTREKENKHITSVFQKLKIEYRSKKLDFGDYSFEVNDKSYENQICIERKNSLSEIAGNFTKGRDRFRREFERAFQQKCKVHLMIENGSIEQIEKGEYRSRFSPSAFLGSLKTWCWKFQINLLFTDKKDAAEFIIQTFQQHLKEEYK